MAKPKLPEAPEAFSLFGDPLFPQPLRPEVVEDQKALYDAALKDWTKDPDDADAIIWLGRRTAYLGRIREAAAIFSEGITKHPNDPRMYRHRGHRFITMRLYDNAIDDLEKAVDDKTRAISVSHVEWLTGARHDLRVFAELAHEHGAHLVVDGIQAAGALKVDVKRDGVDFYANGAYKWLIGCSGAGFLYVKEELIPDLAPVQFGYRSVEEHDIERPRLKDNAKRFELGEPSYLSTVGTKAAIELLLGLGTPAIEARVLKLSQRLYDGLEHLGARIVSPREREMRSGVVSFSTKDTEATFKLLKEAGFYLSLRPAGIRVAVDFYNTEEEVDRLLSTLAGRLG